MSDIKILYVGYILAGDADATGNTLFQLFNGAKNIQLMQYCLDYSSIKHSDNFDTVFIDKKRSKLFYNLKRLYRKDESSKVSQMAASNSERKGNWMIAFAKAFLDILPKGMSNESDDKIDSFSPQVIYTLGENISTLTHALKLSKKYNIPIVCHIMDDFEPRIYGYTVVTKRFRQRYLKLLNKVYDRTVVNLAISPKMAKEYENRHGKKFNFAMNCIDELHPQPMPQNKPLKMIFSGGLHGGRAESITQIADLINSDSELRTNLKLIVHTSKEHIRMYGDLLQDKVDLKEYVPKEQMYINLGTADILLHVESFLAEEVEYFRFSMSTKIPECLSVGRPVFCYGPSEICTVSYIRDKGVGIIAESESEVRESLKVLINNKKLRDDFGNRALTVAHEEHLKSSVQAKLYNTFEESIEGWK